MISSASPLQPIHFKQLTELLNSAANSRSLNQPILKRADVPSRLLSELEKELPKTPAPIIFRRLGKHTQLAISFS